MSENISLDFIKGLPKAELHLHLEGTLEPDLKLKLAKRNNISLEQKTVEEIKATYAFDDLPSFLAIYYAGMEVLQTEEDFYDLAIAYLHKAKEHNVRYAELFFDPQAHTTRGIAFETVFNGYYKAIEEAPSLGIDASLIMCFLRDMSAESAEKTLQAALPYKDKILGVGLDSDEHNNPPIKFKKVFQQAKEAGFHVTIHCDIDQQNSIEHIQQALHTIGTERLDHGTNIVEDPKLIEYIKEKEIGLTTCPVSNSFVTDDMKGKEILALLRDGVKVTVNSDDPAYFRSYVSDDIYALSQKYEMTQTDVVQLAKNSFEIAFTTPAKKLAFLKEIDDYLAK